MRMTPLSWALLAVPLCALGAPSTGKLSSSENPLGAGTAPQPVATYGLCSGPQNADDFPSSPVPAVETQCEFTQQFHSTSPTASYGGSCGGYTVTFGPKGDLKRKWKYLWLKGEWGDAPLTQANCATAHVAAATWGYLCTNAACTTGAWERIAAASTAHGTWNTASQVCYLSVQGNTGKKDYQTVSIDIIVTQGQGRAAVRKRAKGSIYNVQPNGKCPTATYTPYTPP
jgi:hypothetical protein